jgi:hypothetical protein
MQSSMHGASGALQWQVAMVKMQTSKHENENQEVGFDGANPMKIYPRYSRILD